MVLDGFMDNCLWCMLCVLVVKVEMPPLWCIKMNWGEREEQEMKIEWRKVIRKKGGSCGLLDGVQCSQWCTECIQEQFPLTWAKCACKE